VGRPIHEMFDLIAGTSTGGIIAVAIGAGANHGAPYPPADLVNSTSRTDRRFSRSIFTGVGKWFGPKYSPDALERILLKFFGETELAPAKVPLLIGSYDIENQIPFFFKSQRIHANPNYKWKLRPSSTRDLGCADVLSASAGEEHHDSYTLVNGGVCVNNPAMAAYAEARHIYGDADYLVVSVGTGDWQDRLKI
jgi:patatin-like phospholipase/acyl hydrolase